jgi:hypothetical protein
MAYGLFLCAFALIPNNLAGRAAFLFCGGLLLAIGVALGAASRRALRRGRRGSEKDRTDAA